jgi:enoyl-CoA hydratase/carnithine racemase
MDRLMRHALLEALQIAQFDEQIHVEIDAEGPSFSTGGDLDEFGSATDPGAAHLIRVSASVGQLIHRLRARVVVRVHGACLGAGIELPAFAGRIVAAPDAVFGLPEVAMGLIPGAGGTVSIPARIGRARTFWLAVSGEHINAATAREWGLVDEVA